MKTQVLTVRIHMETAHNKSQPKGKSLPKSYIDVPPVSLTNITTPTKTESVIHEPISLDSEMNETQWLEKFEMFAFADESQTECENISWSAYYANLREYVPRPPGISPIIS